MAVIRDKMPAFQLFQPASTGEALGVLDQYGADAWVLAGGLDSWDWFKDRVKKPAGGRRSRWHRVTAVDSVVRRHRRDRCDGDPA